MALIMYFNISLTEDNPRLNQKSLSYHKEGFLLLQEAESQEEAAVKGQKQLVMYINLWRILRRHWKTLGKCFYKNKSHRVNAYKTTYIMCHQLCSAFESNTHNINYHETKMV